uniref:Uncharacterized protein n=1 Tax=Aegilops tauschii subsp. strangulata TaxID=200361 RepID=A0A453DLJ0_AEGTS
LLLPSPYTLDTFDRGDHLLPRPPCPRLQPLAAASNLHSATTSLAPQIQPKRPVLRRRPVPCRTHDVTAVRHPPSDPSARLRHCSLSACGAAPLALLPDDTGLDPRGSSKWGATGGGGTSVVARGPRLAGDPHLFRLPPLGLDSPIHQTPPAAPNLFSSPWRLAREDPDPLDRGCGGHAPAEESSSSDTIAYAPSSFNPLVPCRVQPPHTPLLAPDRKPSQRAAMADEAAARRRCSAGLSPPRP